MIVMVRKASHEMEVNKIVTAQVDKLKILTLTLIHLVLVDSVDHKMDKALLSEVLMTFLKNFLEQRIFLIYLVSSIYFICYY